MRILMQKTITEKRERGGYITYNCGEEYELEREIANGLCAAEVAVICPSYAAPEPVDYTITLAPPPDVLEHDDDQPDEE